MSYVAFQFCGYRTFGCWTWRLISGNNWIWKGVQVLDQVIEWYFHVFLYSMFIIISKDVNFTYPKCNGSQILVLILVCLSSWNKNTL